jgi:transcriptional regulator with XRE-family HTH domain
MEPGRFPNRLKKFRRIAGYSRKKVASLLDLRSTSMLSRWERGISTPGIIDIFRLAFIYNVLPHELYLELWMNAHSDFKDLLIPNESITNQNMSTAMNT